MHGSSLTPRGGDDGIVEGVLAVRDGCVLLDEADGSDDAYPVAWPAGTSIAATEPLVLELPSGEELTVGERVRGGGGYYDIRSPRIEVDIPDRCVPDTGEVAAFNPDDEPNIVE